MKVIEVMKREEVQAEIAKIMSAVGMIVEAVITLICLISEQGDKTEEKKELEIEKEFEFYAQSIKTEEEIEEERIARDAYKEQLDCEIEKGYKEALNILESMNTICKEARIELNKPLPKKKKVVAPPKRLISK